MSTVLQSEIRLHEGILASLALQSTWENHVQGRVRVAMQLEVAIMNLKVAVQSDGTSEQVSERLLPLLFNLQEMIARLKASLDIVVGYQQTIEGKDAAFSAFLASHTASLTDGIDWMEDLAETWTLSLDKAFMEDIEGRLATPARPASEIRDWRAVLDEVDRDAELHC